MRNLNRISLLCGLLLSTSASGTTITDDDNKHVVHFPECTFFEGPRKDSIAKVAEMARETAGKIERQQPQQHFLLIENALRARMNIQKYENDNHAEMMAEHVAFKTRLLEKEKEDPRVTIKFDIGTELNVSVALLRKSPKMELLLKDGSPVSMSADPKIFNDALYFLHLSEDNEYATPFKGAKDEMDFLKKNKDMLNFLDFLRLLPTDESAFMRLNKLDSQQLAVPERTITVPDSDKIGIMLVRHLREMFEKPIVTIRSSEDVDVLASLPDELFRNASTLGDWQFSFENPGLKDNEGIKGKINNFPRGMSAGPKLRNLLDIPADKSKKQPTK
jgi:DNA-binding XRE family transcriptional regulator